MCHGQVTWKLCGLWSSHHHLVGGIPTPLKNMSSSLGMIIPIYIYILWKNKIHVPNHQPDDKFSVKHISQWEGLSHILWNNKKYLKPPTRCVSHMFLWFSHGFPRWLVREKDQQIWRMYVFCQPKSDFVHPNWGLLCKWNRPIILPTTGLISGMFFSILETMRFQILFCQFSCQPNFRTIHVIVVCIYNICPHWPPKQPHQIYDMDRMEPLLPRTKGNTVTTMIITFLQRIPILADFFFFGAHPHRLPHSYTGIIYSMMSCRFSIQLSNIKLVGGIPTPLKNIKIWKSVGIIIPNSGKIKAMFQTTNQIKSHCSPGRM